MAGVVCEPEVVSVGSALLLNEPKFACSALQPLAGIAINRHTLLGHQIVVGVIVHVINENLPTTGLIARYFTAVYNTLA